MWILRFAQEELGKIREKNSFIFSVSHSKISKFFFFFYWRYNPLWVLAFSVIFFHSALSLHNFSTLLFPLSVYLLRCPQSIFSFDFLCFSYLLVSTLVLFWVYFFLTSASRDPAKPFFCFLQISLYLHFLLGRSARNSFWFSRIHLYFALDQRFFSLFCSQMF